MAQKLDIRRVIIPLGAGVASAFGFLASPMSFQFVQASICALDRLDAAGARALIAGMELKGRQLLRHSGTDRSLCNVRVSAAMCYVGQGYEVEVPVGALDPVDSLAQRLADGFDQSYAALYGRTEKDAPAEVVSWRVAVQGPTPDLTPAMSAAAVADRTERERATLALKGRRPAYSLAKGDFVDTPIYDRYRLRPGARLDGPAIIEERDNGKLYAEMGNQCRYRWSGSTTTPGWSASGTTAPSTRDAILQGKPLWDHDAAGLAGAGYFGPWKFNAVQSAIAGGVAAGATKFLNLVSPRMDAPAPQHFPDDPAFSKLFEATYGWIDPFVIPVYFTAFVFFMGWGSVWKAQSTATNRARSRAA